MACKSSCKLCKNLVISQSVTIVAVDGVDTLVIDLPARFYGDGCKICVIIGQNLPAETTITTPVAFSIGGDTGTVFPFVRCDCSQVTACAIRTRTRYSTIVSTNAIGGVFKSLGGLSCCPNNNLESLLVTPAAATTPVTPAAASIDDVPEIRREVLDFNDAGKITKIKTTTTKEVVANG